jgi:signal transduction histidine kinase
MSTKSIKQKVSDISIYSFMCMSVIMFTCFWLYSAKKNKITENQIRADLTVNLRSQTNQFLPSFLLPEQAQGMILILNRIKVDENLEDIKIIKDQSEIPTDFKDCRPNEHTAITCPSNNLSLTAVVAPLKEMNHVYGFIFKSKKNSSAANIQGAIQFAAVSLAIIAVAFLIIYLRLRLLIAKTLPDSMNQIVQWIEAEIEGKELENISLPFKELEDLKFKIAEVIERANKSRDQAVIGQVTSGIMHDIRTPLQSVVAAIHLVGEQEENSPKRLSRLENLFAMCLNNIPLVGQIIEATLDGNRDILITKLKSNLRETLDSSLKHTNDLSRRSGVTIEVNAPEEINGHFDQSQLIRVMNNLLKNGIEAAAENHDLRKVRISLIEQEHKIMLTVEDSGSGFKISPDKAFRAFRTTKTRGTGLGLLISKKIIEAHSGVIKASNDSVFGGAKLEVVLPA